MIFASSEEALTDDDERFISSKRPFLICSHNSSMDEENGAVVCPNPQIVWWIDIKHEVTLTPSRI
jgi:hypothetical protein